MCVQQNTLDAKESGDSNGEFRTEKGILEDAEAGYGPFGGYQPKDALISAFSVNTEPSDGGEAEVATPSGADTDTDGLPEEVGLFLYPTSEAASQAAGSKSDQWPPPPMEDYAEPAKGIFGDNRYGVYKNVILMYRGMQAKAEPFKSGSYGSLWESVRGCVDNPDGDGGGV